MRVVAALPGQGGQQRYHGAGCRTAAPAGLEDDAVDPLIELLLRSGQRSLPPHGIYCAPVDRPAVDVFVGEETVGVLVDVAGAGARDVTVDVLGQRLLVRGRRRDPRGKEHGTYHMKELDLGPFAVEIPLPVPVRPAGAEAWVENGLLEVRIPRHHAPAPAGEIRIEVMLRRIAP